MAAPRTPALLEDLPNELLLAVIGRLSPSDFCATIAASPQCFRAFKSSERLTLLSVLQRVIFLENWDLSLGVCDTPSVHSLDHVYGVRYQWGSLPRFASTRATVDFCWRLLKLSHLVEKFVAGYAKSALEQLRLLATPERQHAETPSLSYDEHCRLQRTFLLFESYRKFYWYTLLVRRVNVLGMKYAMGENFIKSLPRPWMMDELDSVYAYMWRQVEDFMGELEDDLISKTEGIIEEGKVDPPLCGLECSDKGDCCRTIDAMSTDGLEAFGDQQDPMELTRRDYAESITALGLPVLDKLRKLNSTRGLALAAYWSYSARLHSFNGIFIGFSHIDIRLEKYVAKSTSSIDLFSSGWLLARSGEPAEHLLAARDDRLREKLTRTGIVFWDKARLQDLGLLGLTSSELATRLQSVPDRADHFNQPSVQTRLRERHGMTKFKHSSWEKLRPETLGPKEEKAWLRRLEY